MTPGRGRRAADVDTAGLPAGPTWPSFLQTVALLRFRHWFHPWLHKKYGDVYTVRLMPKGRPLVLLHPARARQGDLRRRPRGLPRRQGQRDPRPGHGRALAAAPGRRRAQAGPQAADAGVQRPRAARPTRTWSPRSRATRSRTGPRGSSSARYDRMNALTLEVILRVVFGVTDEQRLAALRPRVNATVNVSPAVLLVWGAPGAAPRRPVEAASQNQIELDRADVRRDPRAPYRPRPGRAHRRAVPADPRGRGDRRPAQRHRAARPARHPAAGRPRDHRDRAGLGALRARPRTRT